MTTLDLDLSYLTPARVLKANKKALAEGRLSIAALRNRNTPEPIFTRYVNPCFPDLGCAIGVAFAAPDRAAFLQDLNPYNGTSLKDLSALLPKPKRPRRLKVLRAMQAYHDSLDPNTFNSKVYLAELARLSKMTKNDPRLQEDLDGYSDH